MSHVDQDGYSDPTDDWISHPNGFADAFPNDESQWFDTDNDGYGDNIEYFDGQIFRLAYRGDGCRTTLGTSTLDRWGCPDSDEDGYQTQPIHGWPAPAEKEMHAIGPHSMARYRRRWSW